MWVFLSRRLRVWAVFAIGVPLASWLLGTLGRALERRRGPSTLTRLLTWVQRRLDRRARGPFAGRPDPGRAGPDRHLRT
jgi:hypothetical protein